MKTADNGIYQQGSNLSELYQQQGTEDREGRDQCKLGNQDGLQKGGKIKVMQNEPDLEMCEGVRRNLELVNSALD